MSFAFVNKLGEKVSKSYNNPYDAFPNQNFKPKLGIISDNIVINILDTKMISVKWAVLCAKHVLHIYEEQYPDDKRPRKAIELALNWIKDPSEKNRKICSNHYSGIMSNMAGDAASDSRFAASAADDSYVASYAAFSAASNAANSASNKSLEIKWQRKKLNQIVYEEILLAFAMTQYQRKDNKLVRKIPKELLEYIASYLTMS